MTTDHATEMALIEAARAKAEAVWLRCSSPGATAPSPKPSAPATRRPSAAARG